MVNSSGELSPRRVTNSLLNKRHVHNLTVVLVFKSLHGLAPAYLSEYRKLTTGRSHVRSANACLLSVPRTRTTYGDRSFAVSGHLKTFLCNCLGNSYVDSYTDIDSYVTILPSLRQRIFGLCELELYKCPY